MAKKTMAVALFLTALFLAPTFALDAPVALIPDDSAARLRARDDWLRAGLDDVARRPAERRAIEGGGAVEIRAVERPGEVLVVFARQRGGSGEFLGWAQGAWEFARSRADGGAIARARFFPRGDPGTYARFRPHGGNRVWMDVLIHGAYLTRGVSLPISMDRLAVTPFGAVLRLAGDGFPVRYFEPNPDDFRDHRLFMENVRRRLPELRFADDGGVDCAGRFVYIATGREQRGRPGLNCSGFSKWLVDGLLRPVMAARRGGPVRDVPRLAIPPLREPFGNRGTPFTDAFEHYDPFFGLDWIRNLASVAGRYLVGPAAGSLEKIDVRCMPFSHVEPRRGPGTEAIPFPAFRENIGHDLEGLLPLLYVLAIDNPGKFFLGAINVYRRPPINPRGPTLRLFFHITAFVPYFDERGDFRVAVFESAAETSMDAVMRRYAPGHSVSLVRVPLGRAFDP